MKKENRKATQEVSGVNSNAAQQEDAALKVMMQFFADELLPYLGIPGKVVRAAPTETVQLELHKSFEDFNLVMEDGSWKHFEFQSKNGGKADLKRFRAYEANLSYQYDVDVTTYVLFSGGIKKPMTAFTEGVNTYRICPIIMQKKCRPGDLQVENENESMQAADKGGSGSSCTCDTYGRRNDAKGENTKFF